MSDDGEVRHLPVDELMPTINQSRQFFDDTELKQLAENIKANGQLQPGVAWLDQGRGKYVIICGERRWRAIKLAGLPTMAMKVLKGDLTPGQMLAINLSENLQRASLNPVERAKAFQQLAKLEGLTSRQVAERMNVSDATVCRDLAILELPEVLQLQVAHGLLPVSVAAELRRVSDSQAQLDLAEAIASGRLTRDQVAHVVRARVGSKRNTQPQSSRLTARLDGLSFTVSGSEPISWDSLLTSLDRLRREARKMADSGRDVAEFGKVLAAKG
jgi:ParB family transcriptional regulator, chromosome partitioning protein